MVENTAAEAGLEEGQGPNRLPAHGEALDLPSVEDRHHRNGLSGLVGWAEHAAATAGGSTPEATVLLQAFPTGVARIPAARGCL